MSDLDRTLASEFGASEDLWMADPEEGIRTIRRVIGQVSDGKIFEYLVRAGLNIDGDIAALRDRLERFEIRKYFGANAAPWNLQEDVQPLPELSSSRLEVPDISAQLHPFDVPSVRFNEPQSNIGRNSPQLATGQTFGAFRDPISMQAASHRDLSQTQYERRSRGDSGRGIVLQANAQANAASSSMSERRVETEALSRPVSCNPQAQSTRFPSAFRPVNHHDNTSNSQMDLTAPIPSAAQIQTHHNFGNSQFYSLDVDQFRVDSTTYRPLGNTVGFRNPEVNSDRAPENSLITNAVDPARSGSQPIRSAMAGSVQRAGVCNFRANDTPYTLPTSLPSNIMVSSGTAPMIGQMSTVSVPAHHTAQPIYSSSSLGPLSQPSQAIHHPNWNNGVLGPPISSTGFGNMQNIDAGYGQAVPGGYVQNSTSFLPPPPQSMLAPTPVYPSAGVYSNTLPSATQQSYGPLQWSNNLDSSLLAREKRINELFRKWHVDFKGSKKMEPEAFLKNLSDCVSLNQLSIDDVIRALPSVLDDESWTWYRREHNSWKNYDDVEAAFRLQFGVVNVQDNLKMAIKARTQGPNEDISSYLMKLRLLMDQRKPPKPLQKQLDRAYQNLHPSYSDRIAREQFSTFQELQQLGKKEEARRLLAKSYRPPPSAEECLFPESAYSPGKNKKPQKVAAVDPVSSKAQETSTRAEGTETPTTPVAAVSQPRGKPSTAGKHKPNSGPSYAQNASQGTQPPSANVKPESAGTPNSSGFNNATGGQDGTSTSAGGNAAYQNRSAQRRILMQQKPCHRCHQLGHWVRECPQPDSCIGCGKQNINIRNCKTCLAKLRGNESQPE